MADRLPTVWEQPAHTRAKHELLVRYIGGWFPILSRHNKRIVFLDGFAGPGIYEGGEPGSPRLAIETLLDHHHGASMTDTEFVFLFNELDPERYESLKGVVESLAEERGGFPANTSVRVENYAFSDLANQILTSIGDKNLAPTFAFLDPFGYDVPIDTIRQLLAFDRCELFIYFDYNSVQRFAAKAEGKLFDRFRALFGSEEFVDAPPARDPSRKEYFRALYKRQLTAVCGFKYVQSFEMVTENGKTGYFLFFCTRNLRGLELMKDAMWKADPSGGYTFSDRLAGSDVLFESEPDLRPLHDAILAWSPGRYLVNPTVREWVVEHTPYRRPHLTQVLKQMEQREEIVVYRPPGRRQFAAGVTIEVLAS